MIAFIDAALDVVNAFVEPKANAKRLIAAKKKYGDDELVAVKLGTQTLLLAKPVLQQLIESGLWGMLDEAAERGTYLNSLSR